MNDFDLLDEIRDRPDEDEPRLIYADWLEEQGDPRADLIRVQCALAGDPPSTEVDALRDRERELLSEYHDEWIQPLRACGATEIRFRRGFVEEVRVVGQTLDRFEEIAIAAPLLRHLRVRSASRAMPSGFASPRFLQLRALTMRVGGLDAGAAKVLAEAEHLRELRHLDLSGNNLGSEGVAALADSPHLRQLQFLSLRANRIKFGGSRALVESALLDNLRVLELDMNPLHARGAQDFLELPASFFAERLDLSFCRVPAVVRQQLRQRFGERVKLTREIDGAVGFDEDGFNDSAETFGG